MADAFADLEADLQRLPDPVPSKQVADVLGVKSSALRMMVRRGALDPPVTVGTNQAWYSREAVLRAWWRRQPEHVLREPVTDPKNAEQTDQETELTHPEQTSPAALLRDMMRQLQQTNQAQAELLAQVAAQSAQHQTALSAQVAGLTRTVETLVQELAAERAAREAEQHAQAEQQTPPDAENTRTPSLWSRIWGGGKQASGT